MREAYIYPMPIEAMEIETYNLLELADLGQQMRALNYRVGKENTDIPDTASPALTLLALGMRLGIEEFVDKFQKRYPNKKIVASARDIMLTPSSYDDLFSLNEGWVTIPMATFVSIGQAFGRAIGNFDLFETNSIPSLKRIHEAEEYVIHRMWSEPAYLSQSRVVACNTIARGWRGR